MMDLVNALKIAIVPKEREKLFKYLKRTIVKK